MLWWVRESWITQSIGFAVIFLRIFARTRTVGFRGWKGDDYIIWFTILCNIGDLILVNDLAKGVQTGLSGAPKPTPKDIQLLSRTLKDNFILWYAYVNFLWSLKACMLFLYWRLTDGLNARRVVKFTAWFCGLSYAGIILYLGLHCTPVQRNWQIIPNPGPMCNTIARRVNFLLVGILNIATDVLLVSIPIPLLWRVRVPLRKKLVFGLLLCSGFMIVIVAIIRNVSCLIETNWRQGASTKTLGLSIAWANREQFIAILVVNAPCIKPLFSNVSWVCSHPSDALAESDSEMDPEANLRHRRRGGKKEPPSTTSTFSMSLKKYISRSNGASHLTSLSTTRHSHSRNLTQVSVADSEMDARTTAGRDVRTRTPTPVPMLLASFGGGQNASKSNSSEKIVSLPASPRSAYDPTNPAHTSGQITPGHITPPTTTSSSSSNNGKEHKCNKHNRAHSHTGNILRRHSLRRQSRHARTSRHSLSSAEILGSNPSSNNGSLINMPLAIHTTRTVDVVSDVATERDRGHERIRNIMNTAPFRFEGDNYLADSSNKNEEWELRRNEKGFESCFTDVSSGGRS